MWYYKDKKIQTIEDLPDGVYGFIYIIRNLSNGKAYVGKKTIFSEKNVKLTKKDLLLNPKTRKKTKLVKKESKWVDYAGSSPLLLEDIKSGHEIKKEIIEFAFSKRQLTYLETKYLFLYNVLEDENFYNQNILYRFYKGNLI